MADKILLVEDDPVNVKFIQVVLTRRGGFEVTVCEEVDEILRFVREEKPVLVIMDVSLTRSTWEDRKVDGLFITTPGSAAASGSCATPAPKATWPSRSTIRTCS